MDRSPWEDEGEEEYCRALLRPVPGSPSLIPILFKEMYDSRPDLQLAYPDAHLRPAALLRWIATNGILEYEYVEVYDRYRPAILKQEGLSISWT